MNKLISIQMNEEEYAVLLEKAKQKGVSPSEYVKAAYSGERGDDRNLRLVLEKINLLETSLRKMIEVTVQAEVHKIIHELKEYD